MALVLKDRVKETTATTGTGTITLSGAVAGFDSFSVIGNGNTTYYAIVAQTPGEWEVGLGTYTASGTLLSRDTVLANSAGTQPSKLSFSAGTKDVFVTYPAGTAVTTTDAQTLTNKTLSADSNTLSGVAASSFVLSNASGNIDGAAAQKAIPAGVVVGTTDTQTLTNKTISGATNTITNVSLTTGVTGTLPIANGGTNSTATPTNGGVAYGTGSAVAYTAAGTSGFFLRSNGAAAPTWVANPAAAATAYTAGTVLAQTQDVGFQSLTALGYGAGASNTTGGNFNTFVGYSSGAANTSGYQNTAIGFQSLQSNTTGYQNTAIGRSALATLITGNSNTAVGWYALSTATSNRNTAVGSQAMRYATTAQGNQAFGELSLTNITTGIGNTCIGYNSLSSLTTGQNNCVLGGSSGSNLTTQSNNVLVGNNSQAGTGASAVAIGYYAMGNSGVSDVSQSVAVGSDAARQNQAIGVTAIGAQSLYGVNTVNYTTAVGYQSLYSNTSGTNNVAVGANSLRSNTTGYNNTVMGYNAGYSTSTGSNNSSFGTEALYGSSNSTDNCAFGSSAMRGTTTGSRNVAVGFQSMYSNLSGADSVGIGNQALRSNTTATYNVAVGSSALWSNTTTGQNVAIGGSALYSLDSTGGGNVAVGHTALESLTGAFSNVAVGTRALGSVTTGQYNVGIGASAGQSGTNDLTTGSNNIIVGYNAATSSATVSNTVTLGNTSISALRCQVTTITSLSDARDKTNVSELTAGLNLVNALRPVAFEWAMRDGGKVGDHDTGFIAQELQVAQESVGVTIPGLVYADNPDRLEAGYGKLLPVMVKAIQELSAKVDQLQAEIAQLKGV